MTRACALKGGEWLQGAHILQKRVNDLRLDELESLAAVIISEYLIQLASEGKIAETEPVPVRDFSG